MNLRKLGPWEKWSACCIAIKTSVFVLDALLNKLVSVIIQFVKNQFLAYNSVGMRRRKKNTD